MTNSPEAVFDDGTENISLARLCTAAQTIKDNLTLSFVLFAELFIFIVALVLASVFLSLIYRHAFIHINARLLLANLTFNVALTALNSIVEVLLTLFKFARYSGCDLLESYDDCRSKLIPKIMVDHISMLSVFALIVERACATLFARSYEKKVTKRFVIAFISLQWILVFGGTAFLIISSSISDEADYSNGTRTHLVFGCRSAFTDPKSEISAHVSATLIFVTFLLILLGIILLNRYKYSVAYVNRTKHTLSERYQLHENSRGTRLLLPGVIMQCVMCLSSLSMLVIVADKYRLIIDETERIIVLYPMYEWINLLISVCTLLFPILSTVFCSVLAKAAMDMIRCRKQQIRVVVEPLDEKRNAYTKHGAFRPIPLPTVSKNAQKHFAKLTATWEKTFHRNNAKVFPAVSIE